MAKTVLVVEDEPALRAAMLRALADAGYAVAEAPNGEQALRMLRTASFDLVITDILMPEADGLEIVVWLHRAAPQTRVIAISGYGDPLFLDSAAGLGADHTLAKPFRLSDLVALVRDLLCPCSPARPAGTIHPTAGE